MPRPPSLKRLIYAQSNLGAYLGSGDPLDPDAVKAALDALEYLMHLNAEYQEELRRHAENGPAVWEMIKSRSLGLDEAKELFARGNRFIDETPRD